MISNIRIQNYKAFKSFSLQDIPPVLLIGGRNNVGKTSFLEAIHLILDWVPHMFTRHQWWRGMVYVHPMTYDVESLFVPIHHNFDLKNPVEFHYTLNSEEKHLKYKLMPNQGVSPNRNENISKISKPPLGGFGTIEISYGNNPRPLYLNVNQKEITLPQHELLRAYNNGTRFFLLASSSHASQEDNIQKYSTLDKEKKTSKLLDALKILEPRLQSLSINTLGGQPILHADVGMARKVPLALMGQGVGRLMSILLGISGAQNGIVLLDELENGFHHSVLPRVWKIIMTHAKENGTQIIATAHSRDTIESAIEGIPESLRDDFQYTRMEKTEGGECREVRYEFSNLDTALRAELEVR